MRAYCHLISKEEQVAISTQAKGGHEAIPYLEGYQDGKKAGIKEVVDDMELALTTGNANIVDLIMKYRVKLKEWGIIPK